MYRVYSYDIDTNKEDEMNTIRKTTYLSNMRERIQIKAFKTSQEMHAFLNKQHDNDWKQSIMNLKSGQYAWVGGELMNVKKIDKSMLSHV